MIKIEVSTEGLSDGILEEILGKPHKTDQDILSSPEFTNFFTKKKDKDRSKPIIKRRQPRYWGSRK